ncbi:hypothetical protein ACFL2T_06000 [Elusimicrobiota bacterium]
MTEAGGNEMRVRDHYYICGLVLFLATAPAIAQELIEVDDGTKRVHSQWLKANHRPPIDYVAGKIREYPLVILGERHQNQPMLTMIADNLGKFYDAGLRAIVLEMVGPTYDQQLEKLVTAEKFNRKTQLRIAGSSSWLVWNSKEQWDLLEAVWTWNRGLPKGAEPLRVVGMADDRFDRISIWLHKMGKLKDAKKVAYVEKIFADPPDSEKFMAERVSMLVDAGTKTLVLVGYHHAFTRYHQPVADRKTGKLRRELTRLGNILRDKYEEKLFQLILHFPHESPKRSYPGYKGDAPVLHDYLEDLFEQAGASAGGFDLKDSPIGAMRDRRSYYFYFQPKYDLRDMADGYLFLGPLKDEPKCVCIKNFVSADIFAKNKYYFEVQYGRKFESRKELNEHICPDVE